MKYRHAASTAVLLFFVLLAAGSMESQGTIQQSAVSKPVTAKLSAVQLFAAYNANEVAADAQYKGNVVVVTGSIESIGKDILGTPYVALKTNNSFATVQCLFADEHIPTLASAARGQQVTVKGVCDGKMMNVILRGCSFE